MTNEQQRHLCDMLARFYADRPTQSPAAWCCENLLFDEPDNRGPFSLAGREYMREVVDDWADPLITDQVEVFGSQTGKTGGIMGGAAWTVCNDPSRIFWVMPTRDTVRKFSKTRWMPLIKRNPRMAELIPTGARRFEFATAEQRIGGSIVDMVWSNSPAALAGVPARVTIADEVDKFNEGGGKEADALNLLEQRTKNFTSPKRIKTSTPTLVTGLIWQEFLKTDQRRRFVPCPHCKKFVVLVWSKAFTVFKLTGEEACVEWDKEAKRADGTWDMDRVERSARYLCPHCAGHILDAHKTLMDRNGVWRPTAEAARGYRGRHLPSLYAPSAQSNVGVLARKFLQAQQSLLGLQGFINGDLAEPYESQDTRAERTELITSRLEVGAEWNKLMTVDCQEKSPHFYIAARAWNGGNSTGIKATSCDTWDDLRAIQKAEGVKDVGVIIDSGFGAKDDAEVYRNCARFCEFIANQKKRRVEAVGWMPSKGMPGRKKWKHPETGLLIPYYLADIDPFIGTAKAGKVGMSLFEFAGDYFKDILETLRKGRHANKWSVADDVAKDEEYWRHLDGEHKVAKQNKFTGRIQLTWIKRGPHWPNHWFDCEVMQIAAANFFNLLTIE